MLSSIDLGGGDFPGGFAADAACGRPNLSLISSASCEGEGYIPCSMAGERFLAEVAAENATAAAERRSSSSRQSRRDLFSRVARSFSGSQLLCGALSR